MTLCIATLCVECGTMSNRTLKLSVLAMGIFGGAVLLLPGGEVTKPAAPVEVSQLQQQIAKLEERVGQLELQARVRVYAPIDARDRRLATPVPGFRSVPNPSLPEGWQQREFNGAPYYIVPLEAEQGQTSSAR